MTNDLISREGLFHKMEEAPWYNNADRDEIAEELVLDAPAVDAVPVVRVCSGIDNPLDPFIFCPNCGAKMDGKECQ